jgi:cytochrome c biogenesis protein CcmG, thiol:disulfide interchange protein DsbE
MRRRLVWLLAAAALVAIVAVGLSQSQESKGPSAPKPLALTAADVREKLAGAPPRLAALHRQANELLPGARDGLRARLRALRGHPVVVNVWGSWCGPCRLELPVFQRASLRWGKRVAFVGVDLNDSREGAASLLRTVPLPYPSYEDPHGKVYNGYRLAGTPSTIFYDAAGRQTYIHQGPYYAQADLDAQIERYALGRS